MKNIQYYNANKYADNQYETRKQRNEYLASFDGSAYDTGKHTVLGTMVVRVSTNLTTTKQEGLSEVLIEALKTP